MNPKAFTEEQINAIGVEADRNELKAAAERVRKHMAAGKLFNDSPYWNGSDWDTEKIDDDLSPLAHAYLRLTDPTPLSERVLRDAGFTFVNESLCCRLFALKGDISQRVLFWTAFNTWKFVSKNIYCEIQTVGELNWILDRLNPI